MAIFSQNIPSHDWRTSSMSNWHGHQPLITRLYYPKLKKIDFSTFDCILYSQIKSHNYKAGFKACGFKQSNQLSKISIKVHCRESIKFHESQGKTSGIALVNVYFQSSSTYDPLSQIAIGFVPPENKPCAGWAKDLHENHYFEHWYSKYTDKNIVDVSC